MLLGSVSDLIAEHRLEIDSGQSSVEFRIKMMDVSYFVGQFDDFSGIIRFDPERPSRSSVTIEVRADSIRTKMPRLTKHLRSPDFLNARQFPILRFTSRTVSQAAKDRFRVLGTFEVRGNEQEVEMLVELVGIRQGGKLMVGFSTEFVINRHDFGISYLPNGLADEVTVRMDIHSFVP